MTAAELKKYCGRFIVVYTNPPRGLGRVRLFAVTEEPWEGHAAFTLVCACMGQMCCVRSEEIAQLVLPSALHRTMLLDFVYATSCDDC